MALGAGGIGGNGRRRVLVAVGAAALCALPALATSGCGSVAGTVDPVAQAATVSTKYSGYRMNFAMQLSSPALPAGITATGHGAFNISGRTGSMTLAMDLGSIPQVRQLLGTTTLQIKEISDGLTFYIELPAGLAGKIPGFTKPWVKIDLARAAGTAGIPGLGSLLSNPASSNPSQFLQYLRAASGSVTKVGAAPVNGVPTTHYRATINLDRVANALPAGSRAQARQAIAQLEHLTNLHALPVNVWVDGQHLVRRMRFSYDETIGTGQPLRSAITVEIPEYGPQPVPALPAASQVLDATNLAHAAG